MKSVTAEWLHHLAYKKLLQLLNNMSSAAAAYPGWVFRLNTPTSSSNITDENAITSTNSNDVVLVNDGSCEEGVQLLPKNTNNYGLSSPPTSSPKRYLAELYPHGCSVATLPSITRDIENKDITTANELQRSNSNNTTTTTNWSWSYSSQSSPSQWNVTSSNLLSVTYRPAHEAYPSYTNISTRQEVWHKSVTGTCCTTRNTTSSSSSSSQPERKWGKVKRRITGAPKPIHRVTVNYTVDDIIQIEPIVATSTEFTIDSNSSDDDDNGNAEKNGVWIRGIGNCHALKVYLRPKFGSSFADYNNDVNGGGDDDENSILADKDQSVDFELPDMDKWDNLPSPSWDNSDSKEDNGDEKEMKHLGPIITFAIPCQDNSNDDDDTEKAARHNCPPLLWKVDHPPNPHVALDSFLLMDGALHLQNEEKSKTEGDEASSCSYDYDAPTNVYIHGYQSWSFSGSVVQGEAQPKSAMPNILSAAFNRGGMVMTGDNALSSNGDNVDGDYWSENLTAHQATLDVGDDSDDDELNEQTAFYKSDMFACISSNGATTSQYDDERILLDEEGGPAVLIGFLAQRKQYGAVLLDKDLSQFVLYACHEGAVAKRSISSDWAYCQIVDSHTYDEEAMVYYVHATGDHNDARPMEKGLICGWCSWYHYYADIDHDSLSKNAHVLEKNKTSIGFNVCLIDDGYMTAWGDWTSLKPGKFVKDGGMRVLSNTIRSKGMQPGVWLAPFACDKSSQLAKDHPDWIIRNDMGRYANSANCGKFFYGLDATNPAVRKHVYDTIRRAVDEWGFDVLKLDFLYASCLEGNGKYDPTMSRAEAMHLGLRTIRAAAGGSTFIIGCGCPIGSAVGFVDGMRVSCDTGPTWIPEFPLPHWDNGTLPALRGMLRNTISRSPFGHRWWHNDPDCILLGASTKLTDDEVVTAASIVAMTGVYEYVSSQLFNQPILYINTLVFP